MKKLRGQSGMTLTELLCAVIVVLLFSSLVAVGANAAVRSFRTSMADAQAQELCSTLVAAISDKLRYCGTVDTSSGKIFIQDVGSVTGGDGGGPGQRPALSGRQKIPGVCLLSGGVTGQRFFHVLPGQRFQRGVPDRGPAADRAGQRGFPGKAYQQVGGRTGECQDALARSGITKRPPMRRRDTVWRSFFAGSGRVPRVRQQSRNGLYAAGDTPASVTARKEKRICSPGTGRGSIFMRPATRRTL